MWTITDAVVPPHAIVAYDHARHAPLGDIITIDFINTRLDPGRGPESS